MDVENKVMPSGRGVVFEVRNVPDDSTAVQVHRELLKNDAGSWVDASVLDVIMQELERGRRLESTADGNVVQVERRPGEIDIYVHQRPQELSDGLFVSELED